MKNSQMYNCHKGNGRNFGIKTNGQKVQIFSYYTNGHMNSDYSYGRVVDLSLLEKELGTERLRKITEEGKDGGQLERLFFNGY